MATLIAVYTSSGCVGRCDAKCHDAQSPECDCVCGGANHGVGIDQAIKNTRELADLWIPEYAEKKELTGYRALVNRDLVDQGTLFDISNFSTFV